MSLSYLQPIWGPTSWVHKIALNTHLGINLPHKNLQDKIPLCNSLSISPPPNKRLSMDIVKLFLKD